MNHLKKQTLAAESYLPLLAIVCVIASQACVSPSYAVNAKTKALKQDQPAVRDARILLQNGDAQSCETKMATLLRDEPGNAAARLLHAEALYKLGRFHFASDELATVSETMGNDADVVLFTAKVDQSLHKPNQAIEMYKSFLALSPRDEQKEQYLALISVLEGEVKEQQNKQTTLNSGTDNYLNAVCLGSLERWKSPKAIRVYVTSGSGVTEYRPEFEESLRQAFDDWSQLTAGKLAFVFVPDKADADMVVTWTSDLHAPNLVAEAGFTKTAYGPDGLTKAEIQLLTVDPFKDAPIGKNYLYNVCLHEIGHALGLVGHSPNPNDIMAPTLRIQQGLSGRDIRTVLALYQADLNAPLPMVDEYGRPLSSTAKAERLAHEGYSAMEAKNFEQAAVKLEQAIALDPKTPMGKHNLAVSLNNLGIASGVTEDKALSLFHHALFFDTTADFARANLNSYLQNQNIDPQSFEARVKLGDDYLAKRDSKSAFVEYGEALKIRDDAAVKAKQIKIMSEH